MSITIRKETQYTDSNLLLFTEVDK